MYFYIALIIYYKVVTQCAPIIKLLKMVTLCNEAKRDNKPITDEHYLVEKERL